MPADELTDVLRLAEGHARAGEYGEIHPTHLLLGLLEAERDAADDPYERSRAASALESARESFDRVRAWPHERLNGRPIPLSSVSRSVVGSSSDRASLRVALKARRSLQVTAVLRDLDAGA